MLSPYMNQRATTREPGTASRAMAGFVTDSVLMHTLVASLAAGLPASAQDAPQELVAEMRDAGFSDAQITVVKEGGIVTRVLPQRDDNAAFVAGVVRIAAPDDALANGIRGIELLRRGGRTLQIGRFGTPPTMEDIQPLVLERRDLDDLRSCRVGDCDVQIGRHAMELIHAIDWEAADARERAAQLTKGILLAQVRAYLEQGSSAMATYDDNDPPESVASSFEQILRDSPSLVRSNPTFYRYLLDFPNGVPPPNVESLLYWSKEKLRRPVVSVVHVSLQRLEDHGRTSYYIAMKHIYDSHYFLAYAEFLTAIPEPGATKGFYLVRSIRALIDPPRGWFRGFLLGRIKGAMRDELAKDLRRTRTRLEFSSKILPSSPGFTPTGPSRRIGLSAPR
jgi:hypothetical protein